ncbi:MAG: hypothetical protein WBG50_22065 [Desulfomonilaceae bacterium]
MEKRKITAKELLSDIRSGVSDQELMRKYSLSSQGLQSVFSKMVSARMITQAELDDRIPITERTVDLGLFICPACGNIQGKEFAVCPRCGFTPPGKAKAVQDDRTGTSLEKSTSAPMRRRQAGTQIGSRAVPPLKIEEDTQTERASGTLPDLSKILTYCRVVGIAALISYVLIVAGIFVFLPAGQPNSGLFFAQTLLCLALLSIPAIVFALIVLMTLRTLTDAMKIVADVAGPMIRKRSPQG